MNVCGYDPYLSVDAAWRLSRDVKHEVNLDGIYAKRIYQHQRAVHGPDVPYA